MDKKNDLPSLTKQDWINQGTEVLTRSGVEAVRVEPLAKLMNVTKGSFYWHFKNREALLAAIVQDWVDQGTNSVIQQVEAAGGDANQRLLLLLELAMQNDVPSVENAIRAWASSDPKIAAVLRQVDRQRLEYTRDLFVEFGFTPFEALARARIAYYTVIGDLTIGEQRDTADRLAEAQLEHTILTYRP
jgi:AcrR family transcriptional regulator